MTKIGQ